VRLPQPARGLVPAVGRRELREHDLRPQAPSVGPWDTVGVFSRRLLQGHRELLQGGSARSKRDRDR
jgi:hypothetical protein